MSVPTASTPVVIVSGAARSGTAALAAGIAAAGGHALAEAGPAFGLIATLAAAMRDYEAALDPFDPAIAPGPLPEGETWLRDTVLGDFFARIEPATGYVLRGADLLPGAPVLRALPRVAAALPSARCVHIRRNGIDFVQSRMRALAHADFASHCLAWAEDAEAWRTVEAELAGRVLTVEQSRLSAEPDAVAAALAGFLGWGAEAGIRFVSAVRMRRLGRSGVFGAGRGPSLADVSWSHAEKDLFCEICGPAMEAAGYPLDREAALRRQPLRLIESLAAGEGRAFAGSAIGPDAGDRSAVLLQAAAGAAQGTLGLVVPCVSLASRTQLDYRLAGTAGRLSVRLRVRESLSRRDLGEVAETTEPGRDAAGSVRIAETPELVDIEITAQAAQAGTAIGLRLLDATFRHVRA